MRTTGIIHVFDECDDCVFTTEDHRHGLDAKRHAKRRSHRVNVDVGKIEIINHRKETP